MEVGYHSEAQMSWLLAKCLPGFAVIESVQVAQGNENGRAIDPAEAMLLYSCPPENESVVRA